MLSSCLYQLSSFRERRTWRTHWCVPCRDSSRHLRARREPGGTSADAARTSACATSDLLRDSLRRRGWSRRGRFLCRGLLHRRSFLRRLGGNLRGRLLDSHLLHGWCGFLWRGFLRGGFLWRSFLRGGGLHFGCFRQPPAFLGSGDDPLHPFFTDPAFGLRRFGGGRRWRLRLPLRLSPPLSLRFGYGPAASGAQLSPPALRRRLRWCGSLGRATGEHLTKLCDLSV